jgi:hypothetical protein
MRMTDLTRGWAVVGNDGRRVGTIREVGQNYVLVSRSAFSGDIYVPASAIANVENDVVHLNLAKREADAMGWEQPPRVGDDLETKPESDLHRHV